MPEYLPQVQLPTGLAEEMIRQLQRKGEAWQEAIKSLGQSAQQYQQKKYEQSQQKLTPADIIGISQAINAPSSSGATSYGTNLTPGAKSGPGVNPFGTAPVNAPTTGGLDPNKPLNMAGRDLMTRLQEQKATENRMMAVQGLKGKQAEDLSKTKTNEATTLEDLKAQHKKEIESFKAAHPKSSDQTLTKEEMDALKKATTRKDNPLDPSIITYRGPRAKIIAQSLMDDPNYSPNPAKGQSAAATSGASAAARLQAAGPPQILARYAQSTKKVLDVTEKASEKFPRFGEQFLNTPYIKMASQSSPEALQFKQSVADLRGHIAAVLSKGYAPQKEQIDEAAKYIPDSITPKQLKEDIPFLKRLIDIQTEGMMTPVAAGGATGGTAPTSETAGEDPLGIL